MNRKTTTLVREETRLHHLVPYTVEVVDKRDIDCDVQSEPLDNGIELRVVDESDTIWCSEKMESKHGWAVEPPRSDNHKHLTYRTKFLVYRNGVAGKFNIHGVEVSELKVSTMFWLQSEKKYGETRLFINGDFVQSPAELSKYERIHFTPNFMHKGCIGIDYHMEVRDNLRKIIIRNLISSN